MYRFSRAVPAALAAVLIVGLLSPVKAASPCPADARLVGARDFGIGPRFSPEHEAEATSSTACTRRPLDSNAAYRLEDLADYISLRFQAEYDPWYNDIEGVIEPPERRYPDTQPWSRVWIAGLYFANSEVYEFRSGAEIVHFDTMATWFAIDSFEIPGGDVSAYINKDARIACNGNLVLFLLKHDRLDEKERREVDLFIRFFREFTPRRHRELKTAHAEVERWMGWLGDAGHFNFEDALIRLEDQPCRPAGHPELYDRLKIALEAIENEIDRWERLRGIARHQLVGLARERDLDDLLAWGAYDQIVVVGDFGTLEKVYELSRLAEDADTAAALRTTAARLIVRLPYDHFTPVPPEFSAEYRRAIDNAREHGELDALWAKFSSAERATVHEIRRFGDLAVVELRFSKNLSEASYTFGGAWVLLDRSDPGRTVCEVLDTWTF